MERLGCEVVLREKEGEVVSTDNGNYVLDCRFAEPFEVLNIALNISVIPGVLEHGLFLGLAKLAYVATPEEVITLSV